MVCCYYCESIHTLLPVVRVLDDNLYIQYYRVCWDCKLSKLKYIHDKKYYIEINIDQ